MCFSAPISFAASGLLATVSIREYQKNTIPRVIALVPLLFGLQQLMEGLQWLAQPNSFLSIIFAYIFLGIAHIVWPVYTPAALYSLEPNPTRKRILRHIFLVGLLLSIASLIILVCNPLTISLVRGHIVYDIFIPDTYFVILTIIYCLVIALPFFVHSHSHFKLLGLLLLIGIFISAIFYYAFFTSIWCFFCALFSALVVFICPKEVILQTARVTP